MRPQRKIPAPVAMAAPSARVRRGVNPNSMPISGEPALHAAAACGQGVMVVFVLAARADPNSINKHGYTPLHEAARRGHADVVKLLLAGGATTS